MAKVYDSRGAIEIPGLLALWYSGDEYPGIKGTFVGEFPTHESGLEERLSDETFPDNVNGFERFDIRKISLAGADVNNKTLIFDVKGAVGFGISQGGIQDYDIGEPLRVNGGVFNSASPTFKRELGLTRERVPVYIGRDEKESPFGLLDKDYFLTQRFSFGVGESGISVDKIVVEEVEFVKERGGISYDIKGEVFYSDADGRDKTKRFRKTVPGSVLIEDTSYSPESAEETDLDKIAAGVDADDRTRLTPRARINRARSRLRGIKLGRRDFLETIVTCAFTLFVYFTCNPYATNAEKMEWRNAMSAISVNNFYGAVSHVKKARDGLSFIRRKLVGDLYDKFRVSRDQIYMLTSGVVSKDDVPGAEARSKVGKVADAKPRAKVSVKKRSERVPGAEARRSYAASVAPFRSGDPLGEQYGSMIESQYRLLASQGREFNGGLVVGYEIGSGGKIKNFVVNRSQSDRNALGFGDYLREELRKGDVNVRGDPGIYLAKFNLGGRR